MRVRAVVATLLVAIAAPLGALCAQKHIAGVIAGLSASGTAIGSGLSDPFLPDLGFTSTVEFNRVLSIGTEARYVRKNLRVGTGLQVNLSYVETPLFLRIADPGSDRGPQLFARVGVAPAVEIHCARPKNPHTNSHPHNSPETGRIIGFGQQPTLRDLSDEMACIRTRQRTLDFGLLSAIGMSFTQNHDVFAFELRRTAGTRNLTTVQGQSLTNHTITLLLSTGTRGY